MEKVLTLYPYFGGKRQIAKELWEAMGEAISYYEPFLGSAVVALHAPSSVRYTVLNDLNGDIANVWRAVRYKREEMMRYYQGWLCEIDYHVWRNLCQTKTPLIELLHTHEEACDPKRAMMWVIGQSAQIGYDFTNTNKGNSRPEAYSKKGIFRYRSKEDANAFLVQLEKKMTELRAVILNKDWRRSLSLGKSTDHATAIFLDPPYDMKGRNAVYSVYDSDSVYAEVRQWAIENGHRRNTRIVLCGYDHPDAAMPEDWVKVKWKANGGFGNQRKRGMNNNNRQEAYWLSPQCNMPAIKLDAEDTPTYKQIAFV